MLNRTIQPELQTVNKIDFVNPSIYDITQDVKLFFMKDVPNETARFEIYFEAGNIQGEKGIPTFENAKEKMTADLIKEKKFQMYAEMMKGNSLEEIASKVASKVIEDKEVLRKASSLPEVGSPESENDLIGTCFGIASGKISEPIQGKAGVFVIRRDADVVAQNSNDNYLTDQEMLLASIKKSNYGNLLRASLVECLEVNDLRNNPN